MHENDEEVCENCGDLIEDFGYDASPMDKMFRNIATIKVDLEILHDELFKKSGLPSAGILKGSLMSVRSGLGTLEDIVSSVGC